MQKITIIGAGPAGLLLAHYLLSRDRFQVEMYDRLDDPRLLENAGNRTFPLSLQERGTKALQGIPGLAEKIADRATFCTGSIPSLENRESSNEKSRFCASIVMN